MRPAFLAVLLLALPCLDLVLAQDNGVFTNADYRFRIARPDAPWQLTEPTPPQGAVYALKIAQTDNVTETSVTVYVLSGSTAANSQEARDAAQANWTANAQITGITSGHAVLSGVDAYWLRARYDAAGTAYTLHQHFIVSGEYVYIVQCAGPESTYDHDAFQPLLETFELLDVDLDAARLKRLADRCGSEIGWAASWAEAASRAQTEQKLILVAFEVYRGIVGERYSGARTFMNRDLVELINERFVAMYWTDATNAPFDNPAAYGLSGSTFGQGMLFATADGRIIGQCVSFNAFHVYDIAREVLRLRPGAAPQDPNDVRELLRRGDLDAAERLLKAPTSVEQWRLTADLWRRRRNGEKAIAALEQARKLTRDRDAIDADEGAIRLRLGEYAACEKLFRGNDSPPARFWTGVARALRTNFEDARGIFVALTEEHPDSPWAWRAAALLRGLGVGAGWDRQAWPSEAQMRALDQPGYEPVTDLEQAREDAIAFLLNTQHASGAWFMPFAIGWNREDPPTSLALATSSLCAESLLPYRDRARADGKSIEQAIEATLKLVLDSQLETNTASTFDYTIWSQIFGLRFLARCIETGLGERPKLVAAMNRFVTGMATDEFETGGWAYARLEVSGDNPIGFTTAAGVLALLEAKAAGARVPIDMVERACNVLDSLRHPSGSYGYMTATGRGTIERQAEAAQRGPLYQLALIKEGKNRGSVAALKTTLDIYMRHRAHTIAERGKGLCHTSPEGLASYYLLYGYAFSAESLAELPERDRARYRAALLADVLAMRQADGSFCDNPTIGRQYGTAMALQALTHLQ